MRRTSYRERLVLLPLAVVLLVTLVHRSAHGYTGLELVSPRNVASAFSSLSTASFSESSEATIPVPSHRQRTTTDSDSDAYSPPTLGANQQLLDLDTGTVVYEGSLPVTTTTPGHGPGGGGGGTTTTSYITGSISFDGSHEFILFYVNASTTTMLLNITISTTIVRASDYALDIDQDYLKPEDRRDYQQLVIKPVTYSSICPTNSNCVLIWKLTLATGQSATPYHLSILQKSLIAFDVQATEKLATNTISTWGLQIDATNLPILFEMMSQQNTPQTVDMMLYMFNAENPLQWISPGATYTSHVLGSEIDIVMGAGYIGGGRATVNSTGSIPYLKPKEGGNPFADPNFGLSAFPTNGMLLLLAVHCTERSVAPSGQTESYYFLSATANWSSTASLAGWDGSTYGIVGALTLLVLCLISCGVAFLRRRCRSQQDMMIGGVVLTREQRAELPTHDAEGRPIRYDAHGRVLPDLGATKAEIEALVVREYADGMVTTEDAHCTICLGDYEEKEIIKDLPCGHHFHSECISKWLMQSRHCSTCRQDIKVATNVAAPPTTVSPSSAQFAPAGAWCTEAEEKEPLSSSRPPAVFPSAAEADQTPRQPNGSPRVGGSVSRASRSVAPSNIHFTHNNTTPRREFHHSEEGEFINAARSGSISRSPPSTPGTRSSIPMVPLGPMTVRVHHEPPSPPPPPV